MFHGSDFDEKPWCARGRWRGTPGDLRDCISVPLLRGPERVGTLDLRARQGDRWRPEQLGLVRWGETWKLTDDGVSKAMRHARRMLLDVPEEPGARYRYLLEIQLERREN